MHRKYTGHPEAKMEVKNNDICHISPKIVYLQATYARNLLCQQMSYKEHAILFYWLHNLFEINKKIL